jgi:His/Glu/Gln/Arg/opine family amino acid ABC transporter permease subunit
VFDILFANLPYLLKGAVRTFWMAALFVAVGSALGIVLGSLSAMAPRFVGALITAYVFVIRGIPILVLMFIAYYAPTATMSGTWIPSAGGAALALYTGSYVTEITRGSILAVPKGQIDAARSIGMRGLAILRHVILPQAVRLSLPSLVNNSVIMIKATAYVSLVGVWELTYAAREVVERTLAPFEIFLGVMLIYFAVCYPLSLLARRLERRYAYVH